VVFEAFPALTGFQLLLQAQRLVGFQAGKESLPLH
jgi:hypothetical protein